MAYFLSPVLNEQQFDANGDPLAGGQIETYLAGTLTPVFTYKTEIGTAHSNPIVLDSSGNYPTGTQLWLLGGSQYKFIVKSSVVTGGVTLRTIDNITGINDSNLAPSEWVQYTASAFTYLSPTSFSVVGDQTNIFQVNRRVQTTNTGGTAYGTILTSIYIAPNTIVTLTNTSGALDSGLSSVAYGLLSASQPSIPLIPISFGGTGANNAVAARAALEATRAIQPIAAPVASNALTLTLNPTSLEFRATTLNSGTVNTRLVPSAISLVISSGSTLGTTNGAASILAVLAIDNAGTVELAVSNLSGAVNLDENGVISTTAEGGIGGADSATVIYSATARTNVPYRIVGFIEVTQATAGTWVTAPSKIVTSSDPLAMWIGGYGQNYQNVAGSRVQNTPYTNTTGRSIMVNISGSNASGSVHSIIVGGITVASVGVTAGGNSVAMSAEVPPGAVYQLSVSVASINNLVWAELR